MNAVKLSLAGVIGFAFACVLLIGSLIFSDMNVMIEKKSTVSATVDGSLVNINCSVISPVLLPLNKVAKLVVQGHGFRGPMGFGGRAIAEVHGRWSLAEGYKTHHYNTMLNGYSSYHGSSFASDNIAGEVTSACLSTINL